MVEHVATLRVRYAETDQMGVVYHANYLHYFEVGRTELLRASGIAYTELEKKGVYLVVTEAACRFRAAAHYDEVLTVRARVARLGKATVRFDYVVGGPGGGLLAEGHTVLASVNARKEPVRLPEEVAARLR